MNFDLPANNLYGNQPVPIRLPDQWRVHMHSYAGETAPGLSPAQIRDRLNAPMGVAPIREGAKGCKTAVIIIDDISRPTPMEALAKAVIEQLEEAGVPRQGIHFMAAVGLHRAMAREEFVRKLGEDLVSDFRTYSHNPFFNNMQVGVSRAGIPIELNVDCVRADYKIGIGSIFAHPNTGLSGGAKLIVPGIASTETIRRYHTQPADRWSLDVNARQITLDAARLLGLDCKLDALLNGKGEIAHLYVGSCQDNIERNYQEICDFFHTQRPAPADLVIANNYFKPTEAGVACCYPEFFSLVKPGGDLVVAAHSPNGAAAHYLFGKWGEGGVGGLAYAGEAAIPRHVGRYFAFSQHIDRATSLQYHFDPDDPRFHWAKSWDTVLSELGDAPRDVLILPYATVVNFVPALEGPGHAILTVGHDRYRPL